VIAGLRLAGRLARASLLLGVTTMLAASCLVTSTPDFKDRAQTAPNLKASTAVPDPREMLILGATKTSLQFWVELESEDAKQNVEVQLLIDYGVPNELGQPYQDAAPGEEVLASSLDDTTSRPAKATILIKNRIPEGCHTVTMMVTHAFQSGILSGCPADLSDSDQITWTVYRCGDQAPECPPPIDPTVDCPVVTHTCSAPVDGGAP
jgi:hypothetical protein